MENSLRPIRIKVEKEHGSGEFEELLFKDYILYGTTLEAVLPLVEDENPKYKASLQLFFSTTSSIEVMMMLMKWFNDKWPKVASHVLKSSPLPRVIPVSQRDLKKFTKG